MPGFEGQKLLRTVPENGSAASYMLRQMVRLNSYPYRNLMKYCSIEIFHTREYYSYIHLNIIWIPTWTLTSLLPVALQAREGWLQQPPHFFTNTHDGYMITLGAGFGTEITCKTNQNCLVDDAITAISTLITHRGCRGLAPLSLGNWLS